MLSTVMKLTALAGVVGIGFLFLIQAQREVNQPLDQQQNRSTGLELAERVDSIPSEMNPDFAEEVIEIEQSEPVVEEDEISDDPEQTPSTNSSHETLQLVEDDQFRAMPPELTDENRTPSGGGLDFSDSENRILKAAFDGSETVGSPTEPPAVLSKDESSETPRTLFEISPSSPSDATSQPEFDTSSTISIEPLYSLDAETPGDSIISSGEKDAEIPGDSFQAFDGEPDKETPGDAVLLPRSDLSSETPGDSVPAFDGEFETEVPGDFVSSPKGEFVGEVPGESVPPIKEVVGAETPGDSVSSSEGVFSGETPGDAISCDSMPNSSENSLSPFGTSDDAATSSGLESSKNANPISKSSDQFNPFNSLQDSEQNPKENHLEQIHPLIGNKTPLDTIEKSDTIDDFFPADEIKTDSTNNSRGIEAPSHPLTISPLHSREMPAFDPGLNPVPTTNSQTAESDQSESVPKTTFPPVLPDRAEKTLTGQQDSSTESRETDDSSVPNLFESDDSPSLVQDASLNPFDVTPEAAPLKSNSPQPSDGAGNRDNPHTAQQPQLNIEKVAPPNAVLGEPMIYSIIVQNMGSVPVHQVMVVDRIPKGTELMGTIPQAELDENRLIWKIGTFQPNEKRKIFVRITPREVGQIGSVATVHFFSEVAAETNIKQPELKLSISGPSQVRLGGSVVYRFKVTNTGTKEAKQVFIREIISDGLSHPGGKDLEYAVGTLQAGKSAEIELTLTAERSGKTTHRALVTAESGVKIEKTVSLEIIASPLIISRTGPKEAYVDRQMTSINLVTNDSNRSLQNITVTESIPSGMKFVEASSGGRYDPITKKVEWSIDRIGPKQSIELKVKLVPTVLGTQTSVVQAVDADGTKIEVTSQTKIERKAALIVDVVSLDQPITVGELHTLRVFARNRGSATATNVQAKFYVPEEMEFVSAQGPARYVQKGNQIIFASVPEVKGGMQAIYNLTLKARQSGKARIRVDINADQFERPLIRDESISILPAN